MLDVTEIEHQVLHPERRALADGRQLRGLQVRVAERRFCLPVRRERRQRPQHADESGANELEAASHLDEVAIVGDVAARRAEMDDPAGRGRHIAERVHVCHHVVPEPALVFRHRGEVDVVQMRAHLVERGLGDVDAERTLGFREREPEPSPEPVSHLRAPEFEHGGRGVAVGQRGAILGVRHEMRKSVEKMRPPRSRNMRIGPRPA